MVFSLQELPHLNGKRGTVSVFFDNERLGVKLDCDSEAIDSFHLSERLSSRQMKMW